MLGTETVFVRVKKKRGRKKKQDQDASDRNKLSQPNIFMEVEDHDNIPSEIRFKDSNDFKTALLESVSASIQELLEKSALHDNEISLESLQEEEAAKRNFFLKDLEYQMRNILSNENLNEILEGTRQSLESCSRAYCRDFLRPRNPLHPFERACFRGPQKCIGAVLKKYWPRNEQLAKESLFCLREFLLPSVSERIRNFKQGDDFQFPSVTAGPCLLCDRFLCTFKTYQNISKGETTTFVIQSHKNPLGGSDGYDIDQCLPIFSTGLKFFGICAPFVSFSASDYILQSAEQSLDLPLSYLNELRAHMKLPLIESRNMRDCITVLNQNGFSNSQIYTYVSDGVEILRISDFPFFKEQNVIKNF
jgi:hypothetical protein